MRPSSLSLTLHALVRRLWCVAGCAFLVVAPAADAQVESAAAAGADAAWQTLLGHEIPRGVAKSTNAAPSTAAQAAERAALVAHFNTLADEAAAFGKNYPTDPRRGAAAAIEAKGLLKAAFLGDTSRAARTDAVVNQVEQDASLPSRVRLEVVSLAEHLLLRQVAKNSGELNAARESSARYLIKSFPQESGGYLALLSAIEADGDAAKIAAGAQEIERSTAPFEAKSRARVLANRYALLGKSLADVANTALGRGNFFEAARQRRVLLYVWATWSPNSIAYARQALAKLPSDVLVLGYNLDRDVTAARAVAAAERLPGTHYYDGKGLGSWLSLLLSVDAAPLVYATDQSGVIVEVAAQRRDLASVFPPLKAN